MSEPIECKVCPLCCEPFPCPAACTLSLVDRTRVAVAEGIMLAYPEAFVIVQRAEEKP